jgi:molybdate transport system substrate-binding protein
MRVLTVLVAVLMLPSAWAQTPLRVASTNGVRGVLLELEAALETAVGRPIEFELSTARTLAARLAEGEPFDVALLTPSLIDELDRGGWVAASTRRDFARVGVGVGVAEGASYAGVATADALRATLLAAGSVAYGANGQSRQTNEAAFEALGIADAVRSKARLTGPGEAPRLVAAGEIDLVLTLVSELLHEPSVQFLGPLPAELQAYITFTAAMSARSTQSDAAAEFLRQLGSAEFQTTLQRHGLEPVRH